MKNLLIIQLLSIYFIFGQNDIANEMVKEFIPAGKIDAIVNENQDDDYILIQLDLKNDSLFNSINSVLPDLDLFSGIGGIELGFEKAGFKILWSNEFDETCNKTFRHNFNHKLYSESIESLSGFDERASELKELAKFIISRAY